MSTCKDCIHYEACKKNVTGRTEIENIGVQSAEAYCETFKDRSKFVDVSALQQNVIRPLTNRCAEYTKCQTCLACTLEIREHCEHYKNVEQALKESEQE